MNEGKAARYHRFRRRNTVLAVAARGGILLGATAVGSSVAGSAPLMSIATALQAAVAGLLLGFATELAALPFVRRADFSLERQFGLSHESSTAWWRAHRRAVGLEMVGWAAAAATIWELQARWPGWWWLGTAAAFLVVGVVRAGVAPFVFGARPVRRQSLRTRLAALARRAGTPVIGIDEWRLGGRSDVANAVVVGLGPTRRILVSDTLVEDYSDDEIETVVAHELGHHVHRDVWHTIAHETWVVGIGLLIADLAVPPASRAGETLDVAGLVMIALVVGAVRVVLSPTGKWLSRWQERRADAYAVATTRNAGAFVSGLRRLGSHHLAEDRPSRLVEWLFCSHPPLAARIAGAGANVRQG